MKDGSFACENCARSCNTSEKIANDATFMCPNDKCSSKLSFQDFLGHYCELEKYMEQKTVARDFEKAKDDEATAEEKLAMLKIDVENANEEFEKARKNRQEIQEKLAEVFQACAQELRDPNKRENNRRECQICLEEFNNDERKESVLYCGHRACFKCLNSLPKKLCPICRKEFTAKQIIKFF